MLHRAASVRAEGTGSRKQKGVAGAPCRAAARGCSRHCSCPGGRPATPSPCAGYSGPPRKEMPPIARRPLHSPPHRPPAAPRAPVPGPRFHPLLPCWQVRVEGRAASLRCDHSSMTQESSDEAKPSPGQRLRDSYWSAEGGQGAKVARVMLCLSPAGNVEPAGRDRDRERWGRVSVLPHVLVAFPCPLIFPLHPLRSRLGSARRGAAPRGFPAPEGPGRSAPSLGHCHTFRLKLDRNQL